VVFGRHRLLSLIGEGGMGRVYKAHDTVIGRDVAIKVLPTELSAEPGYRERFRREAHAAARLTEPHIIPIYDTGEIEGRLYLVMPVIEGIDVRSLLKRDGPMSPQRAVHVIEQLADALDAAHAVGLVHRDVKPSNALVTGCDFVYLIDFGIARDAAATKLTRTGTIVGSWAYMAPERFTTGTADARSDVYALACVLYECLTGAQPYPGDSLEQQFTGRISLDPPKPSSLNPAMLAGFDEVIARGLAKHPDQRYQSAHDLATAAHHALTAVPTPSRNPHTAPAPLADPTRPAAAPRPTLRDDQLPPPPPSAPDAVRQQAGDLNLAATPQRPPDRPPAPRARPAGGPPPQIGTPPPSWGRRQRRRLKWPLIVAIVAILAVAGHAGSLLQANPPGSQTPTPQPVPLLGQTMRPAPPGGQTVLPFSFLNSPDGVAVDSVGNVYVAAAGGGRVLELAPGSTGSTELPFTSLGNPSGVAVDAAGTVYVFDVGNNRVLKLAAGSNSPTELPFTGLNSPLNRPYAVAVDTAGNLYVTDGANRVLKLAAGASSPTVLPFTDLSNPTGVAVDAAGVYVTDSGNNRVLKLAAGASSPTALPFTDLSNPTGVAVDTAGNLYVVDRGNKRVVKLTAGSTTPTALQFTGLKQPEGVAVDSAGNLYVTDVLNNQVLELAAG
jgi:serine/threonine-protein kinase